MADGVTAKELQAYFERARSWDASEAERSRKEKRNAYLLAGATSVLALAATGLYLLAPLRVVEPYVIRVDAKLGAVDVVSAAKDTASITGDEAVRKYFLAEYIRAREAWIPKASDELYRKAASMSAPSELTRLRAERDPSSPMSPAQRYRGNTAAVSIRSIAFVSPRVGQVRFSRVVQSAGGDDAASDWVATVQFDFADKPTNDATRFYNPLGFVVTGYRVDSELPG